MEAAVFILAGVAVAAFLLYLARQRELFVLSVRDGRVLLVRGTPRATLVQGLAEVLEGAKVRRATVRAVKAEGRARLEIRGDVDAGTAQRLRNVFGIHPMASYRTTRSDERKRNLGQVLGVIWLAWLLTPRR
jgi:hypothetical protein